MKFVSFQFSVFSGLAAMVASAAEPLPLSKSFWQNESFVKSFNGSYRIEARIEPVVSTEVRGVLVEVQELMKTGKREDALKKVKDSPLTAKSPALQFNLGNLYFEEGDLDEAQKAFEAALKEYPSFRRAHRNLGLVMVRKGELKLALDYLLEAMRLGDSDGTTYGLVGYCRLQRGEWASALQAYRMAQLSQPESVQWKSGVAQCLQHLGAELEAVSLLDEVIRQRPEESSYSILQASMLVELEQGERAIKSLELPRRLGRLDGDGLLFLADLRLRAEQIEAVDALIEEAFAVESEPDELESDGEEPDETKPKTTKPSESRILSVIASAMRIKAWKQAGALIEKAQPEEGEASPAIRRASALLDIESGRDPEGGAESLRKLIAEQPTDGRALMALGRYLVTKGQTGEAELLLERAAVVEETAVDAFVELARLRVEQRRYKAALDAVDQALALRPGGELQPYREALARLVEASE